MESVKAHKPIGQKSYGSIPHLIGSRMGPADRHAEAGQCRIATERKRDRHDYIIVQEKLDGGNVGIAKLDNKIIAITRSGYSALSSPYKTHHSFEKYVRANENRFSLLLNEGERVCGEWLLTAVGTKYKLQHEPFVPFDIIKGNERTLYFDFVKRVKEHGFTIPTCLSIGEPLSIESALTMLEVSGHGATETVEGAIWRVERKGKVDFLCKYVRPDKVDGKYLEKDEFNELPSEFNYLLY